MPANTYTDDQLLAAWRSARKRGWPDTFEQCMADPVLFRLIRLEASLRARMAARAQQRANNLLLRPPRGPLLDHKRLAAGERDDD